jgi:hypothetical protein
LEIPLPADLAGGTYEVRVGLYTLENGRLPVLAADEVVGDYTVLGEVEIP